MAVHEVHTTLHWEDSSMKMRKRKKMKEKMKEKKKILVL